VWVGLDVGKDAHYADVLDDDCEAVFGRAVTNDEADLDAVLARAGEAGVAGLVIDQPGSIAQLAIAVAARRGVPVAYVPGLVMRRAADLYPGEAKTDRRDAYVLADTARTRRRHLHWLDAGNDELLAQLRVLNGFDIDLAADLVRLTNGCVTPWSASRPRSSGPSVPGSVTPVSGTCWPKHRPRPRFDRSAGPASTGSSGGVRRAWPPRSPTPLRLRATPRASRCRRRRRSAE
jgi:hypothetical protein